MDPLSALSVAGNIIQFVDFGARLLSMTRELYRSPVGSLAASDEIKLITTDFQALIQKLRQSFCSSCFGGQENDDHWKDFRKICDEAATVAEELLERLGTLKVSSDSKHRHWESVQTAVRGLWNEKEIKALLKRLTALKEALETRILFSIRESMDLQSIQNSGRFDSLDQQAQRIISLMLESQRNITEHVSLQVRDDINAFTLSVTQLLGRLESMTHESQAGHRQIRSDILKQICLREDLQYPKTHEIVADIEMLDVSDATEQHLRFCLQNSMLESLNYTEMTYRYEDLVKAHPSTFEWAFEAPTEEQTWSNLSDWLRTGDGVYWVSGKAGSGKSTFLRHLVDSERLEECLTVWAGDDSLNVATFFFWNSGTQLQKSQRGLLRALLFQVLSKYPELLPIVFPKAWADLYSTAIRGSSGESRNSALPQSPNLTLDQLKSALRAISTQTFVSLNICFVVDGLDEFEGDNEEILEMGKFFKEITNSNQIKVCLSSRPWIVFEELFGSCPNLKLQDLTRRDIKQYVTDKFYQNDAFLRLASKETTAAQALLDEIVEKADGVFLWVRLVVRSLLDGIRNRDELADLWTRLRLLPRELKPLYNRLLELIDPVYLPWASQAIQILRCNRALCKAPSSDEYGATLGVQPITVSDFSLAMSQTLDISTIDNMTRRDFQLQCKDTKIRLTARCAGFLEVSNVHRTSDIGCSSLIQYFHRTAKDFLESEEVWTRLLLETDKTKFNPNVALMRSCLWRIRLQIALFAESARRSIWHKVEASSYVKSFMAYAICADSHTESRQTQTALIDHLDELVAEQDRIGDWLYDLRPRYHGRCRLLELSTLWCLRGYVSDKLKEVDKSHLKPVATSLLQFFLSDEPHALGGVPFPSLEMVSLLLEFGADTGGNGSSPSGALESAYRGLQNLRTRTFITPGACTQTNLQCAHKLYHRIIEMLRCHEPVQVMRISILKRPAERIEDQSPSTQPNKTRKRIEEKG